MGVWAGAVKIRTLARPTPYSLASVTSLRLARKDLGDGGRFFSISVLSLRCWFQWPVCGSSLPFWVSASSPWSCQPPLRHRGFGCLTRVRFLLLLHSFAEMKVSLSTQDLMNLISELNSVFFQNTQGREIAILRGNASPSPQMFYLVLRGVCKPQHSLLILLTPVTHLRYLPHRHELVTCV